MSGSTWAAANSTIAEKYGGSFLRQQAASPAVAGGMSELPAASAGATSSSGVAAVFDSGSGLVAIGAVALISLGLMAFSTTVRVGHAEAHAGVGEV